MHHSLFFKLILGLLALTFVGCNSESDSDQLATNAGQKNEAGFYDLDVISYNLRFGSSKASIKSSAARIFYSYHPSKELAATGKNSQPLFVMLNGGPGCATTLNLFSMNTAPYTLDKTIVPADKKYADNSYTWTEMGSLLYIDAPNTGFSYNTINNVDTMASRILEFTLQSYNPLLDAAQVIRVLLKFLEEHKSLKASEIILVGESYGGTRVSAMLNMLLFPDKYGTTGVGFYEDEELAEKIKTHFHNIYSDIEDVTPEVVARQFKRQILIEPQLTGPYQDELTVQEFFKENSIIDEIAADAGKVWDRQCGILEDFSKSACVTLYFIPEICSRDPYIYTKPATWSTDLEAFSAQSLLDTTILTKLLGGVDVRNIDKLKPAARMKSCRYSPVFSKSEDGLFEINTNLLTSLSPEEIAEIEERGFDLEDFEFSPAQEEILKAKLKRINAVEKQVDQTKDNSLEKVLGKLKSWDDYLIGTNLGVYISYAMSFSSTINPDASPAYGEMFLNNLALIDTFLTDAKLDLIIYSPALPLSFEKYDTIVDKVEVVKGFDTQQDKTPGSIKISYIPKSLKDLSDTPVSRTIFYPYYANSGHSVSSAQPQKFRQDVIDWLKKD